MAIIITVAIVLLAVSFLIMKKRGKGDEDEILSRFFDPDDSDDGE